MLTLTHCPLCNSSHYIPIAWRGRIGKQSHIIPLTNVLCLRCGLVYLVSRFDEAELSQLYHQSYDEVRKEVEDLSSLVPNDRKNAFIGNIVSSYLPPKSRILEIGAGHGAITDYLSRVKDYHVTGIEPSHSSVLAAKHNFNVDLAEGLFDEVLPQLTPHSFDGVIMHHVLEHIPSIHEFLESLKTVLQKDGIVYITVPNITRFNKPISLFFDPLHLYNFSPRTLATLLALHGYSCERIPSPLHLTVVARLTSQPPQPVPALPLTVLRTFLHLLWRYFFDALRAMYITIRRVF